MKLCFSCLVLLILVLHVLALDLPSCPHGPPLIRFPFWLKDRSLSPHSGYPGFELSCTADGHTLLELPVSGKLYVKDIDYVSQTMHVSGPGDCLPKQANNLNLSGSPFQFFPLSRSWYPSQYYALFSCPTKRDQMRSEVTCLRTPDSSEFFYAVGSYSTISYLPLTSCTKLCKVSSVPGELFFPGNNMGLSWSKPDCGSRCEARGLPCRFKNNGTGPGIECHQLSPHRDNTKRPIIKAVVIAIGSFFLLLLVSSALYLVYRVNKEKANEAKVEKFLEDYKALKPTRYSYSDLKRITDDFKDKLGQGAYGTVFKGRLSNEIFVAVKILNSSIGNGEEFINEVGTMGRIHHVNVVRLVGFCADGFRRALVYEFLSNDSLEKFIFSSDDKDHFLGWEKLQDIALGIAKGIEYLHQGCDQRILHFDIKPHNILLDDSFTPKIADFGLAKLCSKDQSAVSMTAARGTIGYIAPEVFSRNFGNVSYKSDVYSFGMMLLEMVGGRKNVDDNVENTSQVNFPEWIYNHLDQGQELRIRITEEGDSKIARKLTIVGLWCIQWYPVDRPSIKLVVQMLEGEGDNLTVPPNPFSSAAPNKMDGYVPGRRLYQELEVIAEVE